MGVFIYEEENFAKNITCNWWNWRPTVEIMRKANLFDNEICDNLSDGHWGLSDEELKLVIDLFENKIIPNLKKEERILLNTSKTTDPDDGTFYREEKDWDKNYSTSLIWLEKFLEFIKSCKNGIVIC